MAEERENAVPQDHAAFAALGVASRDKADAWLEEQTRLARIQAEDLKREDRLRHWGLFVRHISDVLKLAFELALAAIFTLAVVLIAVTLWTAAHDKSLVIEPFSVPPDMAARGLTGQAVAAELQDKLAALQNATDSARPASSYANNWGDDIKVQIPETGVSVSDVYRLLVAWLGHQTHITGEVFRDSKGLVVAARANDDSAKVSGGEGDFDAVLQQAAEAVYAKTQPYRYAIYLQGKGKTDASRAVLDRLATEGDRRERTWALVGLGVDDTNQGAYADAIDHEHRALAVDSQFALAYVNLDGFESGIGHDEQAYQAARKSVELMSSSSVDMTPRAAAMQLTIERGNEAYYLGDYDAGLRYSRAAAMLPDYSGLAEIARQNIATSLALLHDRAGAARAFALLPPSKDPFAMISRDGTAMLIAYSLGDWRGERTAEGSARADLDALAASHAIDPAAFKVGWDHQFKPLASVAHAMLGDRAAAHRMIDATPLDCVLCLRARARIAAAEKDWNGADYWFARATRAAPSLPAAWSEWGRMLLDKGDAKGAVAKFTIAAQKGPRFADPLEGWGEALMAQNRSDLALAKFAEAAKYAPRWDRLFHQWALARRYAGTDHG